MKISLFYPVSPAHLVQGWGTNGEYYRANGINIVGHNGIDFEAYHGQPVYAAQAGMAFYERDDGSGEGVVIVGNRQFDNPMGTGQCTYKTIYWHLCNPVAEPKYASPIWTAAGKVANSGRGVPVQVGDLIGFADNTGLSTGDHLHFGIKPIVPGTPPRSGDAPDVGIGNWVDLLPGNGYLGAIDPTGLFNGYYATQAYQVLGLWERLGVYLQKFQFALLHPSTGATGSVTPPVSTPPPVQASTGATIGGMTKLEQVGHAIEAYEGMDKSTCNPFALRSSPYESGTKCYAGKGCFAIFPTYQDGFNAGMHQLTIVANGTSPVYTDAARKLGLSNCSLLTLGQFFTIYSPSSDQNDPQKYAAFVSNKTGISLAATMGSLLT